MATLTTQVVGLTGTAITFADATSGGDKCATGQGVMLLVTNGGASSVTVTLATPAKHNGLEIEDRAVTVAASTTVAVQVNDDYRDPATGLATITYSPATDLTVAVIR